MQGGKTHIKDLKSQRWAMLTNEHFPRLDTIRLLMDDLTAHKKDLEALDWSEMTHKPLKLPIPAWEIIEQCETRFYTDFYLN